MKLINKYLISDETDKMCFHCHKVPPEKGKNICGKCSRELEAWRKKSETADKGE